MNQVRKIVLSSAFIAFGVVLPVAFHFTGIAGSIFLPMHIPVLIAGLFLGAKAGLVVGVFTPIVSSLTTGMPALLPVMPAMTAELGAFGLFGGYYYKTRKAPLLVSLLLAMILGRLVSLVTNYGLVLFLNLGIDPIYYFVASIVKGLPGIIIQFMTVPFFIKKLEAAGLQENRLR